MTEPANHSADRSPPDIEGLNAYAGRWIAYLGDRIIAQGGTPEQALQAAKNVRSKEDPGIYFVPMEIKLAFSNILQQIAHILPAGRTIYLVGGAVRDAFMERKTKDYDFVVDSGSLEIGRQVADNLGAAYYPLDEGRQTARVVMVEEDGSRSFLDFALLRGPDLESDLRDRDFTINALAIDLRAPENLLDPLGGLVDLRNKVLRSCSASAFGDDPVRILRGIRLAAALNFKIDPNTLKQMRRAVKHLGRISPERLRDELFRIWEGSQPATAMRALDVLGVLSVILPELQQLKGVSQSPPHVYKAWEHTIDTMGKLENVLEVLSREYNAEVGANLMMGLMSLQLGRYREQLYEHLHSQVTADRQLRPLLFMAALYHDAGKPAHRQIDEQGRIRFIGHEDESSRLVKSRARALHLSTEEIDRLGRIVRGHMRPLLLSQANREPSRKAIYKYYRDMGLVGVDACILSLADTLATYGTSLHQEQWNQQLHVIRRLLEAWWEKPEESVSPPELLRGGDIIRELHLEPGPVIGKIMEAIREAQAIGEINSYEEAIGYAKLWLEQSGPPS